MRRGPTQSVGGRDCIPQNIHSTSGCLRTTDSPAALFAVRQRGSRGNTDALKSDRKGPEDRAPALAPHPEMGQHTGLARRFGLYLWVCLTSPRTRGSDAPTFLVGRVDSHIMAWTRKGLRVSHTRFGPGVQKSSHVFHCHSVGQFMFLGKRDKVSTVGPWL